jgi:hypothetical protein
VSAANALPLEHFEADLRAAASLVSRKVFSDKHLT